MSSESLKKDDLSKFEENIIGDLVKKQRKRKKLTQEKVAEAIGISDKHYSKIEMGKYVPSLQTFFKLIDVLELKTDDFSTDKINQREREKDIAEQLKHASEEQLELCSKLISVVLNK